MIVIPRQPVAAVAVLVLCAMRAAAQQDPLDEAKRLYATAAFENALAVLEHSDQAVSRTPDVLEYKVLCLLALGRSTEAQAVAETLVSTAPGFLLSSGEDASPRFLTLFTETRRRLLPDIAKRMFADARGQFRAKNQSAAKRLFEQVLLLTGDPAWSEEPGAEDLRTLASGFLDLMETPASTDSAVVSPPSQPSQPPSVSSPAESTVVDPTTGKVRLLPPVAIVQSMPKWQPRDAVTAQRRYVGAVRVRIGADGHVVSAVIQVPTDPASICL